MSQLKAIHLLLTYACTHECDHCFLFCGPGASGTFTVAQLRQVMDQAVELGTVEEICFEGGEPFLHYPMLREGLRLARDKGFRTSIVTNGYWAGEVEDAGLWLEPLLRAGLDRLSVSDDAFHGTGEGEGPAQRAAAAAAAAGLPAGTICIHPSVVRDASGRGEPVVGGGVLFKGRAAEKLTDGLPTRPGNAFTACEHEELIHPRRVHLDSHGNVHACQGVCLGSIWRTPLARLLEEHDPDRHPICGPLVRGGPHALSREHGVALERQFVDACHCCFSVRKALAPRFPEHLAPPQVYGLPA